MKICNYFRSLYMIVYYSRTSLSGIDQFLSSPAPGRKYYIPVYCRSMPLFDNSETSVYRFIESLMLNHFTVTNDHLASMVTKFPNFRHLRIGDDTPYGNISNWHVLSGLEMLCSLELYCTSSNVVWTDLVPLLRQIGANIKKLVITYLYDGNIDQDRLNLIYGLCPNIEYLDVPTSCEDSVLVIPKFKNLAYIKCYNSSPRGREDGVLQFAMNDGAIMKLEELVALGFDMNGKMLEMMMDHRSFPNLKNITIEETERPTGKIERLRSIVKINNIDIEFDQEFWEPI